MESIVGVLIWVAVLSSIIAFFVWYIQKGSRQWHDGKYNRNPSKNYWVFRNGSLEASEVVFTTDSLEKAKERVEKLGRFNFYIEDVVGRRQLFKYPQLQNKSKWMQGNY